MTSKVYVDMDGVLVAFLAGFERHIGRKLPVEQGGPNDASPSEWKRIQQEWPTFWGDLEHETHALTLWDALKPYKPCILTAIPGSWPSAAIGKEIWVKRMLPKFGYHPDQKFHAVLRAEKQQYAKQPDGTPNILIDDHQKNITEWEAAGGIGFVYTPTKARIRQIVQAIEEL